MPVATAQLSKATLRAELAGMDRMPGTTTGAGSSTLVLNASWIGIPVDFFRGKYLLMTSGAAALQWRRIVDFSPPTGNFTLEYALTASSGSGSTFEVYSLPPPLYWMAVNRAIPKVYPWIYKQQVDFLLADSTRSAYGVPRGMRDVWWVGQDASGSEVFEDTFDRADSASSAGADYVAVTGTWGVISNKLYSVTDTDGLLLTYDGDLEDYLDAVTVSGTLNHATVYRTPARVFGYIDSSNYLLWRLLNGQLDLRKVDGGVESSLKTGALTTSDGVDYRVKLVKQGSRIRLICDDVELVDWELLGSDLKYTGLPADQASGADIVGFRLDKGSGSPATAARWNDWRVHEIGAGLYEEHHDWRQSGDLSLLEFGVRGNRNGLYDERWLRVEGGSPLSLFAADTTIGTLLTDTTATLEILATDPSYPLFLGYVYVELWDLAADPSWNGNLDTIPIYRDRKAEAKAALPKLIKDHAMPRAKHRMMWAY